MEAGRARGYRDDNPRLPALSLGLSSVRLIVNKIEAEYTRVASESRALVKYDSNVDEGYGAEGYDSPLDTSTGRVWTRFANNLGFALSRCIPSVTFGNFGVLAVAARFFAPKMISYLVVYPFCRLVFGTLYPAYASYKAVRTKNLKEYVKWMMYWIVFALFTCTETFTDVFLSWFPFYYEVKIVLVLWLLSPATKGSSILYRKFVHPALCRREQASVVWSIESPQLFLWDLYEATKGIYTGEWAEAFTCVIINNWIPNPSAMRGDYLWKDLPFKEIDEYIAKAKDQGYHTVLNLGTKGVNYATTVIMQTAIKGGGGIVQQLRKSYSLSDLTECEPREERAADEADDVMTEPRVIRRNPKSGYNTRRSASESNSRSPIYFPEVDVDVRPRPRSDEPDFSHIKSTEDISSGYSSADNSASLTRTASLGTAARMKARTTRTTTVTSIKRPQAAEENEVIIEELHDDDSFDYANMPALVNLPSPLYLSHTDPPFIYQCVGDQIKIIQVLGTPSNTSFNIETADTDQWDQKETTAKDASPMTEPIESKCKKEHSANIINVQATNNNDDLSIKQTVNNEHIGNTSEEDEIFETPIEINDNVEKTDISNASDSKRASEPEATANSSEETTVTVKKFVNVIANNLVETSLDTSINDNDSAESDDEASFGTPENSPKSKRKSPKGKYGKGKAPPPPPCNTEQIEIAYDIKDGDNDNILDAASTTSQESLVDLVNNLPTTTSFKESGTFKGLQVVNPIAEKKRRNKSKSPGRISKGSSSGLGKLLQIPNKLAFWNKNNDKVKDNMSASSGDYSRRSSTSEKIIDDFQSCSDLEDRSIERSDRTEVEKFQAKTSDDLFNDASDIESEMISQDIQEKSDVLQKLIEAKLESHPEYKFVSLNEEIPTTSKSTEV